jgi:hypothetical protein
MLLSMNETEERQDEAEEPQSEAQNSADSSTGEKDTLPIGFVPV